MMKNEFWTPKGIHGAEEDPLAERRKRIAEQIRNNQEIPVSPSGELLGKDSPDAEKSSGFETPKGVHGV